MSKFCTNCGRTLEEGEVCECQKERLSESKEDPGFGASLSSSFASFDGGFRGWMNNMLGLHESDLNDNTDCFEQGKKIVPDIVAPAKEEIPIKQYHLVNFRSRLKGLWAEGRLQITNQRVIFRASGRSLIGRTTTQSEYDIHELAGFKISQGVRFSFKEFICLLILLAPLIQILFGALFGMMAYSADSSTSVKLTVSILGIVCLIPFFVVKKHMFMKSICCMMAVGMTLGGAIGAMATRYSFHPGRAWPLLIIALIAFILMVVSLVFYALKPSTSIMIVAKAGTGEAASVYSEQHFTLEYANEVLPTAETAQATKEVWAIISDIQKFGDWAIEKWKAE